MISAGFKPAIHAIKQWTQTAWALELATIYFNNLNFGRFPFSFCVLENKLPPQHFWRFNFDSFNNTLSIAHVSHQ